MLTNFLLNFIILYPVWANFWGSVRQKDFFEDTSLRLTTFFLCFALFDRISTPLVRWMDRLAEGWLEWVVCLVGRRLELLL